jgi:hypothetical protein
VVECGWRDGGRGAASQQDDDRHLEHMKGLHQAARMGPVEEAAQLQKDLEELPDEATVQTGVT